jgi:FMN phosphatase YigB (HAD superfamily)
MEEFWQHPTRERAREIFQTAPGAHELLQTLRDQGVKRVVLSRHDERILPGLMEEFHLSRLFDDVLINGDKGERAMQWLKENGLSTADAVMIGDREDLDILPMQRVGIHAVLIDRPYNQQIAAPRVKSLQGLMDHL